MNPTTNYQLSQWEGGDRILREDFNENNRKIDEAIAAVRQEMQEELAALKAAASMVKVAEVTLDAPANRVDIDLSQTDLRDYERLFIYCFLPNQENSKYTVRLDNIAESYYSGGSAGRYNHCGEFFPNGELQSLEMGGSSNLYFVFSRTSSSSGGEVSQHCITIGQQYFDETGPNSINFTHTGNFLTGSYVRVYGIRR